MLSASLVKIGPVVLEKILTSVNVFSQCCYYPLGKRLGLYLDKLESPSPNNTLYQVWLNLAKWSWRRRFLKFINVLLLLCCYLSLEKGNALQLKLNKLEFPSHKDALCQIRFLEKKSKMWKVYRWTGRQIDNGWQVHLSFGSGELKTFGPCKLIQNTYWVYYWLPTKTCWVVQEHSKLGFASCSKNLKNATYFLSQSVRNLH